MAMKLTTKKQRGLHRIKIIKGLLNKMEDSLSDDGYCIDVMQQSMSIQKALKSLDALILENHMETCVKKNMKSGKKSNDLIKELLELFHVNNK